MIICNVSEYSSSNRTFNVNAIFTLCCESTNLWMDIGGVIICSVQALILTWSFHFHLAFYKCVDGTKNLIIKIDDDNVLCYFLISTSWLWNGMIFFGWIYSETYRKLRIIITFYSIMIILVYAFHASAYFLRITNDLNEHLPCCQFLG